MKEIYYKTNNVILTFHKNSLWERSFISPSFSEKKISVGCNEARFKDALSLKRSEGDDIWEMVINWDKVIMTAKEEFFTVHVTYSGKKKICERVKIKYLQRSVSNSDYNIRLSENKAEWGTKGEICSLIIERKKGLESWMFEEERLRVSFKLSQNKGFTTIADGNVFVSDLSGCNIPIRYIGYDHPITQNEVEQISFTINDIECTPLKFTFIPRPYSYKPQISSVSRQFRYGQSIREVFQIRLVRTDELSPIAKQIKISSLSPNNFCDYFEIVGAAENNMLWNVSVKKEAGYAVLSKGCHSTVFFDIDGSGIDCQAQFSLPTVLPGTSPNLQLSPTSINAYKGDEIIGNLIVKNSCNSEINVSDIRIEASSTNLLKIRGEKTSKIAPNADYTYIYEIDTSKVINSKIYLSLLTQETEGVCTEYNICVKERPEAKIAIQPLDSVLPIVVGRTYQAGNLFCKCQICFADDSPRDSGPIDLSQVELGSKFQISKPYLNLRVPHPESCEVDILFSEETTITTNIIDTDNLLSCTWSYLGQKGKLNIPIVFPKLYGKRCIFYQDKIVFPSPNESRAIRVMTFEYRPLTDEDTNTHWDSNQKLLTQSPYSFSESEIVTERMIIPGESITYFLHINNIEEIDEKSINIPEEKTIDFVSTIQSDNHPSAPISFLDGNGQSIYPRFVTLLPINAKAKLKVVYRNSKGEFRLQMNASSITIPVEIDQQSDDIEALLVGNVFVQNLEKIPYLDNGIRLIIKKIFIGTNSNILHEKTEELLESNIEILNGQPEKSIPIYVDYKKWKESSIGESLKFVIEFNPFEKESKSRQNDNGKEIPIVSLEYKADLELTHIFMDDVYALDLGTTGIVVAKETEDVSKCVILKDVTLNPIEQDNEILSSHTMIRSDKEESSIVLAPAANEYYSVKGTQFRLVPSKFIIGQEKIPFLNHFYDNENIEKKVKIFSLNDVKLDLELTDKAENEQVISDLIAFLYREIFLRCDKEVENIKKLVITYPNTYSIENLDKLKDIMTKELHLNLKGQICFVPESDAVAAYYFDQKIIFNNGFISEDGHIRDEENVIFYDMGAGTLDLSLVSFKKNQNNGIVASIVNKIGIPLAGNYLDYIIFKTLLDDGWVKSDMENKHNAIKELTSDIKKNYEIQRTIAELNPSWLREHQNDLNPELKNKKYTDLFENPVSAFVKACSKTSLKCLIPEGTAVHTVVFSGRASQFGPIRAAVVKELNKLMCGSTVKVDELIPIDNCGDYLKTCVALGALKYQNYFNNDGPFIIENKNFYSKIAVVYLGKLDDGTYDVDVRYLVEPLNEYWDNAELINGTRCKDFISNETISNHVPGKIMYYIQTCLDKNDLVDLYRKVYRNDSSSKDDLNWAFVNLLFKKKISTSQPISVKLTISKENKIVEREIAGDILTDKKLLENIEDSILYKRSMWPFITTLK